MRVITKDINFLYTAQICQTRSKDNSLLIKTYLNCIQ